MSAKKSMVKPVLVAVLVLVLVLVGLGGIKGGQIGFMISEGKKFVPPPEAITSTLVQRQDWASLFEATGTVEADEGITLVAEVQGKVKRVAFKSGEWVKAGEVILEQESSNEEAQLSAAVARLRLATAQYERLAELKNKNTVSQSELDAARQQKESSQGDVDNLKATLQKKSVRAPFDGRLGIRQVDLGQDLPAGTAIVSLQATNRVRVNFPVPQMWLAKMSKGLPVTVRLDNGTADVLQAKITALGADINPVTRNAVVQTSLENSKNKLIPGMAVRVAVTLADARPVLTLPATAIIFAPYGDTVYVIEPGEAAGSLKARQQFVKLGESRGDFVEILEGLTEGQKVAAAGGFKLFNGQAVVESSSKSPEFKLAPTPSDT